ncbi:MAG: recombinase family protein [Ruminococcus sp.]|nr:recombinase family protein [Ruminococcus sp.]
MAKNRKFPFGYMMQNGTIMTNPKEVLAVVTIFRSYLNGDSLTTIAQSMEVPYNEGTTWNKNMVKRIIENEKYLGTDKYPQLIDEDTFHRANVTRISKATSLCVITDDLQEIRNHTFCKECGNRMFRKGGNTRSEKWDCCRKECYPLDYRLTDQMLIGAILNVLNSVIANPSLLESSAESSAYTPSGEVIRQQNEIRHMMDAAQLDYDRTKSEILRLAQMQYDCCTYSDKPQQTELLRSLLVGHEQLNSLDIGLLKSCVLRIWVSHFCTIEIELINGTIIHNITERSTSHGNGIECNDNSCENADSK